MLGRRSLNLELLPLDPDIDRVFRKKRKTPVQAKVERRTTSEMGDNTEGNPNVNVEQPEQPRAENVDYTRSLRDLFAPVATNFASCIVLPPTNATHFDLKPHVIQLLPLFHGWTSKILIAM
jgi:hypothetical protein